MIFTRCFFRSWKSCRLRKRHPWRHRRLCRRGRLRGQSVPCGCGWLRRLLTVGLAAELACGVWTAGLLPGQLMRVERTEEHIRAEWTAPGGQSSGREEIYGVQLLPGTWELRFYRRRESGAAADER